MKIPNVLIKAVAMSLILTMGLFGCSLEEELPSNELTRYDLSTEITESIFTTDVLAITGSLQPFLDRLIRNGMAVHQGQNPPEIYQRVNFDGPRIGLIFQMQNDCIYDEKYPSYADSVFGGYSEYLFLSENENGILDVNVAYTSMADVNYPQFPAGLDQGAGQGFASGEGDDFTVFYKVENARYGRISYQALWIISGTYTTLNNEIPTLSNVTKCMIMLDKGDDPEMELANKGTVRIFEVLRPVWVNQ